MNEIDSFKPTVLNFCGNDTLGLAGASIDIGVQRAFSVHSATVITATTAQNNGKVLGVHPVSADAFEQQLWCIG